MSKHLLGRLAGELGLDAGDIFKSSGTLPPAIEERLSAPDLSPAISDGDRVPDATQRALKRIAAERWVARRLIPGPNRLPVDPEGLLWARGFSCSAAGPGAPPLQIQGTSISFAGFERVEGAEADLRRFYLAHALAHVLAGQPSCSYPGYGAEEQWASTCAGIILLPAAPLAAIVAEEALRLDAAAKAQALVELVARRFAVPDWLAAERMGETGLFAEAAGVPWL